jgi:hypothetical protein
MSLETLNDTFGLPQDATLEDIQVFFKQNSVSYQIFTRPHDKNGDRCYIIAVYMTTGKVYGFKTYNTSICLSMFKFCNKLPIQLELSPANFKFLDKHQIDFVFHC